MQDLSRPWEDPLPEAGERHLAQELRGVGLGGFEMPEWKAKALGKAPTFGIRDVRSIKEQRESLPVFEFRDQIIQAVNDNQVGWLALWVFSKAVMTLQTVLGACLTIWPMTPSC